MSIRRSVVLEAAAVCAIVVTACSEQSPTAPPRAAATASATAPSGALLPAGGVVPIAAQLVASFGTWSFMTRGMSIGFTGDIPFSIDGFWADPLLGKGWIQTNGSDSHFYLVPFAWNPRDTSVAHLGAAIHQALFAAGAGTGPKTNIDAFTHDQIAQTMTPVEALIDQAETTEFEWAVMLNTPQRIALYQQLGNDPALSTHAINLNAFWFYVKRTTFASASSVSGTYEMSVDGKSSRHPFSLASTGRDNGAFAGFYVDSLADQIVAHAREQLGLPKP